MKTFVIPMVYVEVNNAGCDYIVEAETLEEAKIKALMGDVLDMGEERFCYPETKFNVRLNPDEEGNEL